MHRFLKAGNPTSIPGQIGIPAVYSPMTRTLDDLETFWRAVMSMKPWEYDFSVRLGSSSCRRETRDELLPVSDSASLFHGGRLTFLRGN